MVGLGCRLLPGVWTAMTGVAVRGIVLTYGKQTDSGLSATVRKNTRAICSTEPESREPMETGGLSRQIFPNVLEGVILFSAEPSESSKGRRKSNRKSARLELQGQATIEKLVTPLSAMSFSESSSAECKLIVIKSENVLSLSPDFSRSAERRPEPP